MKHSIYLYIFVMWAATYLIRVLPLTLMRREITNRRVKAFLYYVPYVTLAVMTFPAILDSGCGLLPSLAAFAAAAALAWFGGNLIQVAALCSVIAFVLHLFC